MQLHKDSGHIMLLIKPTKKVSSSMTMRFWGIIKLTFKTSLYGLFNHRYITSVDSKSQWLRLKLTCFDWVIKTVVEFQVVDAKKKTFELEKEKLIESFRLSIFSLQQNEINNFTTCRRYRKIYKKNYIWPPLFSSIAFWFKVE